MLSEDQIRTLRDALRTLDWPEAKAISRVLSVVLQEEASAFPPSNEAAKSEVPSEPTIELKRCLLRIAELEDALWATRERADAAEAKYVAEVRKHG
jgi:hypothetical protein